MGLRRNDREVDLTAGAVRKCGFLLWMWGMGWIEHDKQKPEHEQWVWYFFEITGVNYGQYDAEGDCYHGRRGFLRGDVTHWMAAPEPPNIVPHSSTLPDKRG